MSNDCWFYCCAAGWCAGTYNSGYNYYHQRFSDDTRWMNSDSNWYIQPSTSAGAGYFSWASSEPNNGPAGNGGAPREFCVEVRMLTTVGSGSTLRGGHNDNYCTKRNHYMCVLDGGQCAP